MEIEQSPSMQLKRTKTMIFGMPQKKNVVQESKTTSLAHYAGIDALSSHLHAGGYQENIYHLHHWPKNQLCGHAD